VSACLCVLNFNTQASMQGPSSDACMHVCARVCAYACACVCVFCVYRFIGMNRLKRIALNIIAEQLTEGEIGT
jgi:hypothetical protein